MVNSDHCKSERGFSLIEMLVVMLLIAIVVGIAIPNVSEFIRNERLTSQANDIVSDIAIARAEAMRRGGRVTICPSADEATCSADWAAGRIVFVDLDRDMEADSGEEILRLRAKLPGNNALTWSATTQRLQFRASGLPSGGITSGTSDAFKLCDGAIAGAGRLITVSSLGMIESKRTTSCP